MQQSMRFKTSFGWIGISGSEQGITEIVLSRPTRQQAASRSAMNRGRTGRADQARGAPLLREAQAQVLEYLKGTRRTFDLPVDLSKGTPFQRRVWRAILSIPYGRVRSYQWVAARVGGKQYARAVGMALGANPVPLLVPCHRIVAHDGSLGGFSCGLPIKRRLLQLEKTLPMLKHA